jgi:hypothetical protein
LFSTAFVPTAGVADDAVATLAFSTVAEVNVAGVASASLVAGTTVSGATAFFEVSLEVSVFSVVVLHPISAIAQHNITKIFFIFVSYFALSGGAIILQK